MLILSLQLCNLLGEGIHFIAPVLKMTVSCNPVGYFADYTIATHQKNPTNGEGVRQFAKGNLKGGDNILIWPLF